MSTLSVSHRGIVFGVEGEEGSLEEGYEVICEETLVAELGVTEEREGGRTVHEEIEIAHSPLVVGFAISRIVSIQKEA